MKLISTIMSKHPVQLRFISLFLLTTVFACSDHRFPGLDPDRLRLKTLTEETGGQRSISEFQYDQQGKLSGIQTIQSIESIPNRWHQSTYTYDNQNRLSQLQRVIRREDPQQTPKTNTDRYTFSYTGTGQIAEIRYVSDVVAGLLFVCKPQYDATNQIVGNQVDGFNGYQSSQFTSQYVYTNTNLTATHITFVPSGHTSSHHFTYDSQVNPFYGIIMPITTLNINPLPIDPISIFVYPAKYAGIANLMSLSRNNVLIDGWNKYAYTYNSSGLPTSRTSFFAAGAPQEFIVSGQLYFEYESY